MKEQIPTQNSNEPHLLMGRLQTVESVMCQFGRDQTILARGIVYPQKCSDFQFLTDTPQVGTKTLLTRPIQAFSCEFYIKLSCQRYMSTGAKPTMMNR